MEQFLVTLENLSRPIVAMLAAALALLGTAHVVLSKRDSRAAVGWVGLIWLVPVVGAALYVVFGVNRIRRRAVSQRLQRTSGTWESPGEIQLADVPYTARHLRTLARLVGQLSRRSLLTGNAVEPLPNGDAAFPAMLAAIESAERSVALSTYIFDHDEAGLMFVDALGRAATRGVDVRVLVDAVGARYSWPPVTHALQQHGVRTALFGRTLLPWRMAYMNLRNHRKILVVDGTTGFAGGMNIREGNLLARAPRHPVQDLHFRITGPVVSQLQQAFQEDWAFTTGDTIGGDAWRCTTVPAGTVTARVVTDGPDEDFDKARFTLLGALGCALDSVRIMTPYFVPDQALLIALGVAALRGVQVDIVLPQASNLAVVDWACRGQLWQVLERGCRVYLSAAPFDHTKLMLVDEEWTLFGSTNWDSRSLRLNFECDVECYDPTLARSLRDHVDRRIAQATRLTLADVNGRALWRRLRDGTALLLAPYL